MKIPFMKNSRAARNSAAAHKSRLGKDPYFDWAIILSFFFVIMILGLSFGFALWQGMWSESVDSTSSLSTISKMPSYLLNTADLQKIITIQAQKVLTASQYSAGYPGPVDPSK